MSYKGEDIVRGLKRARLTAGLSQRALAERSGVTQSHISQIENGSTEPGLSSLIDLARSLDMEVMLIPRKRIPAVSSLIDTQPVIPSQDPLFSKADGAR
jgi:transcriptional regulator with XRE-family HTH domain